jgi:hypothetical protein
MHVTRPFPSIPAIRDHVGRAVEKHLEAAFRDLVHGPMVVNEDRFIRLITGEPHPFGNFAVVSDSDDFESTKAAIDPLRTCGAPATVLYLGSTGKEVDEYLRTQGFKDQGAMPAMAVEIEKMTATTLPEGYEFVRIGGGKESEEWAEGFAVGYELPIAVARVFSSSSIGADMTPDASVQFFVIFKDAKPISTSLLYLHGGLAGIYCVATVPAERGRGLGAHVTAEPLRIAYDLGYRVGVLQSSVAGYPVYKRLGFAGFGGVPLYIHVPTG